MVGIRERYNMLKMYQIIGLREEHQDELKKIINNDNIPEMYEIRNGYSNPLILSNILKCRIKCLADKESCKNV
jgi:hypothetical protein